MTNTKNIVTIFTPTYNRAYIISNLYESLKKQTCYDFEWLVIDDGSTDNTKLLFNKWEKENIPFSVRYIYKENGGKHTAINKGVALAKGKYFLIVDSDDFVTPDAVEKIFQMFSTIKGAKGKYAGVSGIKIKPDKTLVGSTFEGEFCDASSLQRKQMGITGDKAEVFYTEILKNFPFPEIEGENFCSESLVWNRIAAAGYLIRWFNEPIYVCEYLEDGLTFKVDALLIKNIKTYSLYAKEFISYKDANLKEKAICIGNYAYRGRKSGKKHREIAKEINTNIFVAVVLGVLSAMAHRFKNTKE